MKVWLNGAIIDAAGAIDARERGVTLGDGIFETLAILDGAPLRMACHVARLRAGADVLGIAVPYSDDALAAAVQALCLDQGVREGSARITLMRGPAPRGVLPPETISPTAMISAFAGIVGGATPVRVVTTNSTRRNECSPLAAIKSTNYLDAIIAAREAEAAGADDAILLNTCETVAEATSANVFCRLGDALITPPVSDGALPGIMRACVLATEDAIERSITLDEMHSADEIFLTSSLSIRPVVEIDGRPVGSGAPGLLATRLKDLPRRAE